MHYDENYLVDLWDKVEVKIPTSLSQPLAFRQGIVKSRHPKSGELTVQYDTTEVYRSSGNPIYKTARFPIEAVELIQRDG